MNILMRPLIDLILAIWDRLQPVRLPEKDAIAFGRELERQASDPLKSPHYVEQIRTQHIEAINAETARRLQEHINERKSGPYEPPERRTDAIAACEIQKAIFHANRLRRIQTYEMPGVFPMADSDKWTVV